MQWDPDPGEAYWRLGRIERRICDLREKATRACINLPDGVGLEDVFDQIFVAENDTVTDSGASPWQLLL